MYMCIYIYRFMRRREAFPGLLLQLSTCSGFSKFGALRVYGFRGLGFRACGFRDFGLRVYGLRGFGLRVEAYRENSACIALFRSGSTR